MMNENNINVNTQGGANVFGNITSQTFVGRDLYINTENIKKNIVAPYFGIPPMVNHFIGREELISNLVSDVISSQYSSFSIEGAPGVGKTSAVIALTHRIEIVQNFKDGILWASLGPQSESLHALVAWATAFGLEIGENIDPNSLFKQIKNFIGQKRCLFVIDDVWDLEEAELLQCGGPNCIHLLTSRNRQIARQFAGPERTRHLPELSEASAFQLISAIAPEVCKGNASEVQALIQRVGGLPLAIELLAGYLDDKGRYFSSLREHAIDELSDPLARLKLVHRRLKNLDSNVNTLEAILTLSLDDLSKKHPDAVEMFYIFGAFAPKPYMFSIEAAQAISAKPLDILQLLVNYNLVEVQEESYLTFHQLLADLSRLKTPLYAVNAHRTYYLEKARENKDDWRFVEGIYGQTKWAWRSISSTPELMDFVWTLDSFQSKRGYRRDREEWVIRALQFAEMHGYIKEATILKNNLGNIYFAIGRKDEARELYEQSLEKHIETGDYYRAGQSLLNLGNIYMQKGELGYALNAYQQCLNLQMDLENFEEVGAALLNIGGAYYELGNWQLARSAFENSVFVFEEIGSSDKKAKALGNLGGVLGLLGEYEQALALTKESLHILNGLGDRLGAAFAMRQLGDIYFDLEEEDVAESFLVQSLQIFRELEDQDGEMTAMNGLGLLLLHKVKLEEAMDLFTKSLELASIVENRKEAALCLMNIGVINTKYNRLTEAINMFNRSLAIFREIRSTHNEAKVLNNIGTVRLMGGELTEAISLFKSSYQLTVELGDLEGQVESLINLGKASVEVSNWEEARHAFNESLSIISNTRHQKHKASALYGLAVVLYFGFQDAKNSTPLLREGINIARRNGDLKFALNQLDLLGQALEDQERWTDAIDAFENCLKLSREVRELETRGKISNHLAMIYFGQKKFKDAAGNLRESAECFEILGDITNLAATLTTWAIAEKYCNNFEASISLHSRSIELQKESGDLEGLSKNFHGLGNLYMIRQNWAEATNMFMESIKIKSQLGDTIGMANSVVGLGSIYSGQGHNDLAIDLWEKSLTLFQPGTSAYALIKSVISQIKN